MDITLISDTHGLHDELKLSAGQILIHAGLLLDSIYIEGYERREINIISSAKAEGKMNGYGTRCATGVAKFLDRLRNREFSNG